MPDTKALLAAFAVCFGSLTVNADVLQADAGQNLRDTYLYLEEIEKGMEGNRFQDCRYDNLLSLASQCGFIDRDYLTPEVFVRHVELTEAVSERFYANPRLTPKEIQNYLLPLRQRSESTMNINWREMLHQHFSVLVPQEATLKQAVAIVSAWVDGNLTLIGESRSYLLPKRGDLDPVTVLMGKRGKEIDLTIFTSAALRTLGIATRLVWCPTLRDEQGGKLWLEYLSEDRTWQPWIHSHRSEANPRDAFLADYKGKFVVVKAEPFSPLEVTESYLPTCRILVSADEKREVSLMLIGERGLEPTKAIQRKTENGESIFTVAEGRYVLATSLNEKKVALMSFTTTQMESGKELRMGADGPRISIRRPNY